MTSNTQTKQNTSSQQTFNFGDTTKNFKQNPFKVGKYSHTNKYETEAVRTQNHFYKSSKSVEELN